jgi:lipopolysaccharide transport system ATP-binding protein
VIGYQIENGRHVGLQDVLPENAKTICIKTRDVLLGKPIIMDNIFEYIWVLKDVKFEIKQGKVVGIVGPNGAGKSTLLKILSRITEPSAGRVKLN